MALAGADMFQQAATLAAANPFFEFRLDSLPNAYGVLGELEQFHDSHPHVVSVATCRRSAFGGTYAGTAQQQVSFLAQAAAAGPGLVDIEVETAEELGSEALDGLRAAGAAVILSWHDFCSTPDLLSVFHRLDAFAPDFVKIVPFAQSLTDSLRMIDLLEAHGADGRLIGMSMGRKGVLTRLLGPRYGSAFTFAAADGTEGTAAGQLALGTMRNLYRVAALTPQTAVYAVAGEPIGASLSPRMHNTAFSAAAIDAIYLPLETANPLELQVVIERLGIRGLSVTMPLKETVLPLLASRSDEVERMGACNTLLRMRDGTLIGHNTDVAGIVDPLEQRTSLASKRVLVLGAGGAARAAVFGLQHRGAEVYLLNRTVSRAEALAKETGAQIQPRNTLLTTHFDILINSTPYGMRGKDMDAPITADEMNCDLFFDLVYNPIETPLLQLARARGIAVIPGAAMFVEQGVRQFRMWTGIDAPRDAMTQTVLRVLA